MEIRNSQTSDAVADIATVYAAYGKDRSKNIFEVVEFIWQCMS